MTVVVLPARPEEPTPTTGRADRFHHAPLAAGAVGIVLFGLLSLLAWMVADQNEQRLLDRQTAQAAAMLSVSVSSIRSPVDGAVASAAASDGDVTLFEGIARPLMGEDRTYERLALLSARSGATLAVTGTGFRLPLEDRAAVAELLRRGQASPFVVVDLLAEDRTLGFGALDDDGRYLVYAERQLADVSDSAGRSDGPFFDLDYALYFGNVEADAALIGSNAADTPIEGRRATAAIPIGDRELLLVATTDRPLGGWLMGNLWWMVLLGGAAATTVTVSLLRRLSASRANAIALARENAQKHRDQLHIAETLQMSLLSSSLDAPPGTQLAARYWPAASSGLVGGDFYDAFAIDHRQWGVLIGDVCGKGIEAAAITGLVRHTIRTAARYSDSPADALQAAHRAMADHHLATFCTACFIVYTPDDGRLRTVLGGHPQPLLVRADGTVRPLGQHGTLLGMLEPVLTETTEIVGPGDTLLLYTDGLTDAPRDEAVPIEELVDHLVSGRDHAIEALADSIRVLKRRRRPTGSGDDTALMLIRFGMPTGSEPWSGDRSQSTVDTDVEPTQPEPTRRAEPTPDRRR